MAATQMRTSFQMNGQPPAGFTQGRPADVSLQAAHSRRPSLAPGASQDLALLSLASSASADLRYRRAESLLPCGLTQDELNELLGRFTEASTAAVKQAARHGGKATVEIKIPGGVTVASGCAAGGQAAQREQ